MRRDYMGYLGISGLARMRPEGIEAPGCRLGCSYWCCSGLGAGLPQKCIFRLQDGRSCFAGQIEQQLWQWKKLWLRLRQQEGLQQFLRQQQLQRSEPVAVVRPAATSADVCMRGRRAFEPTSCVQSWGAALRGIYTNPESSRP